MHHELNALIAKLRARRADLEAVLRKHGDAHIDSLRRDLEEEKEEVTLMLKALDNFTNTNIDPRISFAKQETHMHPEVNALISELRARRADLEDALRAHSDAQLNHLRCKAEYEQQEVAMMLEALGNTTGKNAEMRKAEVDWFLQEERTQGRLETSWTAQQASATHLAETTVRLDIARSAWQTTRQIATLTAAALEAGEGR